MSDQVPEIRGERALIQRLRNRIGDSGTPSVPFGDDMASLPHVDGNLLWTTDMLMDGTDFDSRVHGWDAIGRKCLAVNLSDCAAMAVQPVACLAAVALSDQLSMNDAETLLTAIDEFGRTFDCPLVGGDTNSWSYPTVVSITVAATVPSGSKPVRRDAARPNDTIWVTGPLGGSILGRHMTFTPRVQLARQIASTLNPHAMMDISDGLALDLSRILDASGCGAILNAADLEAAIHADARQLEARDAISARDHALHDGEDFELIVILPPDAPSDHFRDPGLIPIGTIEATSGLWIADTASARTPIPVRGWEHFR